MKTILKDIKDQTFKQVYLLTGEETYLTSQFFHRLADAIAGDDTMNVNRFQGKKPDIKEIISLADTMPFFAERRLILIEDSGFFKTDSTELAEYLPNMPETTHIIFREEQVDKRNKLYKVVSKQGYFSEMKRQTQQELERWVFQMLKKEGIQITASAMQHFFETVGTDMNVIKNELDKLISYLGDRKVLNAADIDTMCSRQIEGHIFDMIDAMADRKSKKALKLYYDLLELKEPALRILALITRQYMQLYQVKEMQKSGLSGQELAKAAGLNPYVVKKIAARASRFSWDQLQTYVEKCADLDERIKTGMVKDTIAVEMLITEFSR